MFGVRGSSLPSSGSYAIVVRGRVPHGGVKCYDHPANTFWSRYGGRSVERLRLSPGQRVLDVCCGSGASAIPAAETVGSTGSVVGVDLAENLLALARVYATCIRP